MNHLPRLMLIGTIGILLAISVCRNDRTEGSAAEEAPQAAESAVPVDSATVVERVRKDLPQAVLDGYTGDYALAIDNSKIFTIVIHEGNLVFQGGGSIPVTFYPENDTSFFMHSNTTETMAFTGSGTSMRLLLINKQGDVLEARRVE